jgi:hypothetical protein
MVQNSTANDVNLDTFYGPANWRTTVNQTTLGAIWTILKLTEKPFSLNMTAFMDVNTDVVIENKASLLDKLTLEAAWPTITSKVYEQLCPNVLGDPAAVIQAIHQVTKNPKGEEVTLCIE